MENHVTARGGVAVACEHGGSRSPASWSVRGDPLDGLSARPRLRECHLGGRCRGRPSSQLRSLLLLFGGSNSAMTPHAALHRWPAPRAPRPAQQCAAWTATGL
eukprot:4227999-Karenia_brevis.AAC.1